MERFLLKVMLVCLLFGGYLGFTFVADHSFCFGVRGITATALRHLNAVHADLAYLAEGKAGGQSVEAGGEAEESLPLSPPTPFTAPAPLLGAIILTGRRRDSHLGLPLGWSDPLQLEPRVYFGSRRAARRSLEERGEGTGLVEYYFERPYTDDIALPEPPTSPPRFGALRGKLCRVLEDWEGDCYAIHQHAGWVVLGEMENQMLVFNDHFHAFPSFRTSVVVTMEELGAGGWVFTTESGSVYWLQLFGPIWHEKLWDNIQHFANFLFNNFSTWAEMRNEAQLWERGLKRQMETVPVTSLEHEELDILAWAWYYAPHFIPTTPRNK